MRHPVEEVDYHPRRLPSYMMSISRLKPPSRQELFASVEEFHDLLNQEVFIDVDKLREIAQHGIPAEVRAEVWKYLLGLSVADLAQEAANAKERETQYMSMQPDYVEQIKRIQGEISRYRPEIDLFRDPQVRKAFETVVVAYLTKNPQQQYSPVLVHLTGPFIYLYHTKPSDVFFALCALVERPEIDVGVRTDDKNHRLGDFVTFFRMQLPELYAHFEDEELEAPTWARSWIYSLLAVELPLDCLLRLWDTYFALDSFELHPYVCLAILQYFKEDLLDYEHNSLLNFLKHLPHMDMDKIIAQAFNLRQDIAAIHKL
eukprot:comp5153_c0_seq1/m.1212 comp5153_c0_seq1/g.1212  ORF comp5153_c0_seq1/g.1212 comp5153_c0_seq1/m.1212 type:complete len:316 (-) comp5153_c0_seq1:807-1754(-)